MSATDIMGGVSSERRREPVTVLELALLLLALIAGALLRTWHFGSIGLSHYDEGVYAFSGLGIAEPERAMGLFPGQQKFSPPVYFLLIALTNLLGVEPSRSPFVVNAILGSVTIPVLWWVVRRWFGAAAAVAAAVLLALSEFHIVLSRSALTDVAFALVFLLALAAVLRALEEESVKSAVAAGFFTGLAWNTKYHGWFALVVGAMVVAGRWIFEKKGNAWLLKMIRLGLVSCVVAVVCYLPWALYIQSQPGSSTGWTAYFATMLTLDWLGSVVRHVQQQFYIEGVWSRISVPLAFSTSQLILVAQGKKVWPWWPVLATGLLSLVVGAFGATLVMACWMLLRVWRRGAPLSIWLTGAVVVLWFVMAPVYHPYLRLLLPMAIVAYALSGLIMARPIERLAVAPGGAPLAAGLAIAAIVTIAATRLSGPADPWRPSTGIVQAAGAIDSLVPAGERVEVFGEPALAFHLNLIGHPSAGELRFEELEQFTSPVYFVTGIYLRRAPQPREVLKGYGDRVELLARVPSPVPPDLRLLDDFRPPALKSWLAAPDSTYDYVLWRYTPATASSAAADDR